MKRIAFLIVSIFCLTSCNNEVINEPDIPPENTTPQIELFMPDTETVNVYSTATSNENTIDTIWVLAFNSSGVKQWVEKIPGTQITRNGYASQLLPKITHEPQLGWTIVCIANVDPNPDTLNVTHSTINNCFKLDVNGYYYGTEFLPMYGEFLWQPSTGYTCEMRRAVAKIQVQMGTSVSIADSIGNFSAENVTYKLHNGGKAGYIQPAGTIQGYPDLTQVSSRERYLMLQNSSSNEKETNIYLYEYPSSNTTCLGASVNDTDFSPARQHITLHKANAPGDTTFYRMDFYNPITGKYLDTERNHHYLFTINKVRSEGYRTLNQAQNNPGSNIEYIIEINDGATRATSNGQYAVVTTNLLRFIPGSMDTLSLFGVAGSSNTYPVVSARIQLPSQMAPSSWYGPTRRDIEVQPANYFELVGNDYLQPPTTPPTNETVSIRILAGTPSLNVGVIIFYVGNITHKVYFRYQYAI